MYFLLQWILKIHAVCKHTCMHKRGESSSHAGLKDKPLGSFEESTRRIHLSYSIKLVTISAQAMAINAY